MKALFLIMSLLVNLFFYGQNKADNKPIIIEGYVFDDTCFYEKQGDKCMGREGTEYTNKIKNKHLLKVLDTTKLSRGVYVKFKAERVSKPHDEEPCICSTKLLVNEILEVNTKPTLYEEVFIKETIKACGKSEYVELKGFLINEFEGMVFYEKIRDSILPPIWFRFEDGLWEKDTLMHIAGRHYGRDGITAKIGGTKYTESPYGFGCRVYNVDSAIEISKIIEVDTTYTLHDFNIERYRKRGYYLNRKGDTLKVYEDFKVGKTYKFKGIEYIDEYVNDSAELDTLSANQIKAKEDYTEDEITRYAVTIRAIDAVTIEVTVERLDGSKESKTTVLTSRWFYTHDPSEEYESFYASKEFRSEYVLPVSYLYIDKKADENGKRAGYFYIVCDGWRSVMDIKEE